MPPVSPLWMAAAHLHLPLAATVFGVLGGLVLAALLFLIVCVVCVVVLALLQAVLPTGPAKAGAVEDAPDPSEAAGGQEAESGSGGPVEGAPSGGPG